MTGPVTIATGHNWYLEHRPNSRKSYHLHWTGPDHPPPHAPTLDNTWTARGNQQDAAQWVADLGLYVSMAASTYFSGAVDRARNGTEDD